LRPDSPTYQRHFGIKLTAAKHDALYIPPLMAQGFQTLAEDTEVLYQMTDYFNSELAFGVRWNDPAFAVRWPIEEPAVILARDNAFPDFDATQYERRLHAQRSSGG
jgi:dTDP-4-dehydrorhamnose 3,5-epimerase